MKLYLVLALILCAVPGYGAIIIDNLAGNTDSQTAYTAGQVKAMGFTMGGTSVTLDSAVLRMCFQEMGSVRNFV